MFGVDKWRQHHAEPRETRASQTTRKIYPFTLLGSAEMKNASKQKAAQNEPLNLNPLS